VAQAGEKHGSLVLGEELGILGESGDDEPGGDAKDNGEEALDDEDPAPGLVAAGSFQVLDGECEKLRLVMLATDDGRRQ
jgi:hypothetical protein